MRAQKQADMPLSQIELLDELATMVGPRELVVAPDVFNDAIPTWTSRARLLRFHLDDGPYLNRPDRAQFYAQPWVVASTLEQLAEWQARFIILLPEHPLAEQMAGLPELFALRFADGRAGVAVAGGRGRDTCPRPAPTPSLVRGNGPKPRCSTTRSSPPTRRRLWPIWGWGFAMGAGGQRPHLNPGNKP